MKRYFISFISITLLSILLSSCGTTIYQLKSNCDQITTEELFKSIMLLLTDEDFIVKENNLKLGYLEAETMPEYSVWTGQTEVRI